MIRLGLTLVCSAAVVALGPGCLTSLPIASSCDASDCAGAAVDAGDVDASPAGNGDMLERHGGDAGVGFVDGGPVAPHWSAHSAGSDDLAIVYGTSPSDVYVGGLHCAFMRSTDRGTTWKSIALPDCQPDKVGFLGIASSQLGYYAVVGVSTTSALSVPQAAIYWTADAWATPQWMLDISWDAIPKGLVALGAGGGMLFGADPRGKVIFSDNGGERWRSTADTSLLTTGSIGSVAVLSAKEVWVAGGHTLTAGGAALSHTTDGGSTWSITPLSAFPNALPSDTEMAAIWNASGTLWTSTLSGRLYKSIDGGTTWHGPVLTTGLGPSQFWSSDANNVYALVGTSIMHTPDGGKTWSQEASDLIKGNLSSIWGISADDIYVVGAGGLLLRYSTAQ